MGLYTKLLDFLGIPSETPSQRRRRRAAAASPEPQAPSRMPELLIEYRMNGDSPSAELRQPKVRRNKKDEQLVARVFNSTGAESDHWLTDQSDEYWQKEWDDKVRHANNVVLPPEQWQLKGSAGDVWADGDWAFPLAAKSEEEWELYVYSVKDFPELLKIGIAKDTAKRKESYYKKKLKLQKLPKRDAILIEHLFKHATYHRANAGPPPFNVGNMVEENLIPEIREFMQAHQGSGMTEIRKMTLDEASWTLASIRNDLNRDLRVDQLVLKYGIATFLGESVGRSQIRIPHKWWRTRLTDLEETQISIEAENHGSRNAKALETKLRAALWDGFIEQGWRD